MSSPGVELLERRWFAASAAVKSLQDECDVLRGVIALAEDAWRRARAEIAHLEAIRDALGEQLTGVEEPHVSSKAAPPRKMSAA